MIQLLVFISLVECLIGTPVPQSLDWRTKGAVLPVTNQGSCGSASIFAALDAISAAQQIKHGQLVQLSKQQIYDCSGKLCPCEGDLGITEIYDLIFDEKQGDQIDSEESYPFTGQCNKECNFKKSGSAATMFGYTSTTNKTVDHESELVGQLQHGPVAVEIQASTVGFQIYSGGIFDDSNCKGDQLDHSLLLVGYGTENGVDYWIARNSWGTSWGENGYIRIVKGKNMCGIGNSFAQPFVA